MNPPSTQLTHSSSKKSRLAALLIVFFAVAGIALWRASPGAPSSSAKNSIVGDFLPAVGEASAGHLPNMAEHDIRQQMQQEADRNVFAFKMNLRPVFKNGTGTLRIENPGHNLYPFVVKIFLDKTREEVYDSGGILPNHHIDTARLTRVLPKGEHPATAYIYAYDPETSQYSGKSAVELILIITD